MDEFLLLDDTAMFGYFPTQELDGMRIYLKYKSLSFFSAVP